MQTTGPTAYTAAQIAIVLRMSKRGAAKALAGTAPTGVAIVRGNATPTWTVESLPERMRAEIAIKATANRQSLADYLDTATIAWKPKTPLSGIADECLANAQTLRTALLPSLQRPDAPTLTPADRVRIGLEDYKRAFGHTISARHWQRLIDRTLRRDGGAEDFERLELYLPENPACKTVATRLTPPENEFRQLTETIQAFTNSSAPTNAEKAALWSETFELYEAGAETKREKKRLRRSLVKFLYRHASWLAATERALRVAFDRKHTRWTAKERSPWHCWTGAN